MRLRPENANGTLGVGSAVGSMVITSSATSTPRPIERRMSAVIPTSPTAGALRMVDGVLPMRAATLFWGTVFLEPATCTSTPRGPLGRICQDGTGLGFYR